MPSTMTGKPVPDISLPATGGRTIRLRDRAGRHAVLYFYPKDNTPGCTTQGQNFRELSDEFEALGCDILGVSRDTLKSHDAFKAKMGFPFDLIADTDETLCSAFDVVRMKNMYGRQVRGIERSTFLIDPTGVVIREWRGVKVPGHVQEVLDAMKSVRR